MIFTWTKPDATDATSEKICDLGIANCDRKPEIKNRNFEEPRTTNHDPIPSAFIGGFSGFLEIF
jgi:hypothetical protein